jgi:hypothetical protein
MRASSASAMSDDGSAEGAELLAVCTRRSPCPPNSQLRPALLSPRVAVDARRVAVVLGAGHRPRALSLARA